MPSFYEFFAGGGMARAGLGAQWECLFANEIDQKKGASYEANWGRGRLKIEDVAQLRPADVPGCADLAWASFPCQDLSLAGNHAGLNGARSGTFWPFWNLIRGLAEERRAPSMIVLENVCGALTSHGGKDFAAIGDALTAGGFRFGAVIIDAVHFVPQSRPRLFIVAVQKNRRIPNAVTARAPYARWHPQRLADAFENMQRCCRESWIWWKLPDPTARHFRFQDLIEIEPRGVQWHTQRETRRLLSLMSPVNRQKVEDAKRSGKPMVGCVYKRTRHENGKRTQRAEIRFDDVAGCLRTPAGGSSRQSIVIVENDGVRSRLLSPREAARLMGLPESYVLPSNYNDAYHLAGDGVVVPVVRFLAEHVLERLCNKTVTHSVS
jgi:DNA (cytosine-5)-methyltransferase 1